MALDHNAVVTELWRRINGALTIPLQTAATAASDALLAQIAAEAARDGTAAMLETKADKAHKHGVSDLTDYPGHTVVLGSFSHGKIPVRESDSDALRVGETPKENYHAASKKYVDDSRVLNQVYEAYRTETPIEITASGPIFPFPQGLGGNLTITAILNTTEEYYNAQDGGSRTLWLVRLRDRYGNVLNGSDHNASIVGANWTVGGIGGANYYRYMSPPVGENVELSHTFNLQPGYYIDAIAIRKWDGLGVVGHSLTAVKVESHPDPEAAINALPGHDYVDRVRNELGEQIEDIESGLGDHLHLSEDITDATSWSGGGGYAGRVLRLNEHGKVGIYPVPTADDDLTNKRYVDNELKKKAPLEHRHTSEQIDGLDETLNTAMTTKADITYVDSEVRKKADKAHTHTSDDIETSTTRGSNAHKIGPDTGARVVKTDPDGQIWMQTAGVKDAHHVVNKGYVDAEVKKKADVSHQHSIADVTDRAGTTYTYDLPPNPSATDDLDIVVRTTVGRIKTPSPSSSTDAANKGYVDGKAPWIGSQSAYNSVSKSSGRLYVIT